jgi:hypothetical protein
MNSDRLLRTAAALVLIPAMAACASYPPVLNEPNAAKFGEANRQTMMAQVVDPDPVYDGPMVTSGNQAEQAINRYNTDTVKQPERLQTTDVGQGQGPQ